MGTIYRFVYLYFCLYLLAHTHLEIYSNSCLSPFRFPPTCPFDPHSPPFALQFSQQADVGPFVPQRFEPPADAYGSETFGVRQIDDQELGDVLFSRASSLVDESARPMQELLVELKDNAETKGYQMVVEKKLNGALSILTQIPRTGRTTSARP